ncbi:MAG: ABC transporter substrate-binding protein [Dehalococcoidales bacterium]|nr:ABC transporter substrate-binding protein [Dehalococcoidales bacterium]
MTKNHTLHVLGALTVAAVLLLTSCTTPTTTTTTTTKTTTAVATTTATATTTAAATTTVTTTSGEEEPQYGGTLYVYYATGLQGFDPIGPSNSIVGFGYDGLVYGDWYTPRSEYKFGSWMYHPLEIMGGDLAESWEWTDPQTLIFQIRQGVHFMNKPPTNGRELVADDIKWYYDRYLSFPTTGKGDKTNVASIECTSKYTVVFHLKEPRTEDFLFEFQWDYTGGGICPREPIELYGDNAFKDWKNWCGTGPFMLTDFVEGSSALFTRNPNYFAFDRYHPENRLPYVDAIRTLHITDTNTLLAAMRTGKLDELFNINRDAAQQVLSANSDVQFARILASPGLWALQCVGTPFADVRVRQAVNMAINKPAIIEDFLQGEGVLPHDCWPLPPGVLPDAMYTPGDEMPQIVKDMDTYDPDQAQALLTAAGYPTGFDMEVLCPQVDVDYVSVVAEDLKLVGINLTTKVTDAVVLSSLRYTHKFASSATYSPLKLTWTLYSVPNILTLWYAPGSILNYGQWTDADWWARVQAAIPTLDRASRYAQYKQLFVDILEAAPDIFLPAVYFYDLWQPWVKGYQGEDGVSAIHNVMYRWWWIDLSLQPKH